jgi:hypothetical protein
MIQKEQNDFVILEWLDKSLIFSKWDFDTFKESLVFTQGAKQTKITPQDLKYSDFSCLFYKHEPKYNDTEQSVLNVKFLMDNFQWSSQRVRV